MSPVAAVLQVAVGFVLAADAVAVTAAVVLRGSGGTAFAPAVLITTGAITLFVAMPVYFVLRQFRQETWRTCIAAGFLAAVILAACVLLPVSGSMQSGQEMMVVAGVRTAAGWRMYLEVVGLAGMVGAGAGCVFWAALRLLQGAARWPRFGRLALIAGIGLAIATSWTILVLPALTMDRSCHNVLRDGRRSITPVLFFTVELIGGEWPRFQEMAERFAAAEGWNVDESNDKDKAFSIRRFVNACIEPGTAIRFIGVDGPGLTRADVLVFQPQGGDSWHEPAGRLLALIEAGFPGQLRRD